MTINLAVIGAGRHSTQEHGPALRLLKKQAGREICLRAICDQDESRAAEFARRFGFQKCYTDIDAMLSHEVLQGIVAVSPVTATLAIARQLIPHRIPLVLEKPPGETTVQAEELLTLIRRHRTPHMISMNRRFSPAVVAAGQWLKNSTAPGPALVLARMLRNQRTEPDFAQSTGIHLLDTVNSFLGVAVSASVNRHATGVRGCVYIDAHLRFPAGRSAGIVMAPTAGVIEETYELFGSGYCLQIDVVRDSLRVLSDGQVVYAYGPNPKQPDSKKSGTYGEMSAFVDAIRGRRRFAPHIAEVIPAMRLGEQLGGVNRR